MKFKNNKQGGFVGMLALLIVVVIVVLVYFNSGRDENASSYTESYNVGQDAIQSAKDTARKVSN